MALDHKARQIVLIAGILLAATLLALTLHRSASAQSGTIEFPENGKGVVAVFTAADPEGKSVTWSIPTDADADGAGDLVEADHADRERFSISKAGELTFKKAPDYEMPRDAAIAADNTNTYKVVISATDGSVPAYHAVTVDVTNEDEAATTGIELSSLQPQVSTAITVVYVDGVGNPYVDAAGAANGAIEDPDRNEAGTVPAAGDTGATTPTVNTIPTDDVEWQWSKSSSRNGTFTDIDGDAAKLVSYTPGSADQGAYLRVTATYEDGEGEGKTVMATAEYPVIAFPSGNSAPAFPADFDPDPGTIQAEPSAKVDDGATAGDDVGDAFEANDANNDRLTYSLELSSSGTAEHADVFQIDRATGQVTVGLGKTVSPAADSGEPASTTKSDTFVVTIKATDPSGLSDTATLTITVSAKDEAPVFTAGETSHEYAEEQLITEVVHTFAAYDPEGEAITYSISGTDASKLSITAGGAGELTFLASPNFESPGDANKDNVYEVTVKASDASSPAKSTSIDVTVTVTNAEEAGTVTLSASEPRIGVAIMVTSVTDIDRGVTGVTYQWERADDSGFGTGLVKIKDATNVSYTPVAADDGKFLRVTASYTDNQGSDEATAALTTAVQKVRNLAPKFTDEDTDTAGIQIDDREVAENSAEDVTVGAPVAATDTDDEEDPEATLYLLSGDSAPFKIASDTGQISVGANAKLNKEVKDTYVVTVTARDPEGLSSSVQVNIKVTNVDEAPSIMQGGLAISGRSSISYMENGTDPVETYTATGPESANVRWSLTGDDERAFRISSAGVLTFRSSPDFENPGSADNDNVYDVTVNAADGTYTDTHAVRVTVTDADDSGTQQPTGVVARYDTDNSGRIDKPELVLAIVDYEVNQTLSKADLVLLIVSYEVG